MSVIDDSWYTRPADMDVERTSAGGVVVRIEGGAPLIALAREHDYVAPVIPKGGVEAGETLEAAARREIEEEVGLSRLNLVQKLGALERLSFKKREWLTTHVFLFTTDQVTGTPRDTANHRHGPVWRGLHQLDDMFWPEQRRLIEERADLIRSLLG
jgi:8-oxo-dGTP pyrophosphatase MutT (NUDIX family)